MAVIDAPAYRRTWIHYIAILIFAVSWAIISAVGWFVQALMDDATRGIVASVDGYPLQWLIIPMIKTLLFWLAVALLIAWRLR